MENINHAKSIHKKTRVDKLISDKIDLTVEHYQQNEGYFIMIFYNASLILLSMYLHLTAESQTTWSKNWQNWSEKATFLNFVLKFLTREFRQEKEITGLLVENKEIKQCLFVWYIENPMKFSNKTTRTDKRVKWHTG